MGTHVLYVYGTLRTGKGPTVRIPGVMYDLGWFPGVKLDRSTNVGPTFVAERIEVSDDRLKRFDKYEGYRPDDPEGSLYVRVPVLDGWIYEYNRPVAGNLVIEDGDWLRYYKRGRHYADRG